MAGCAGGQEERRDCLLEVERVEDGMCMVLGAAGRGRVPVGADYHAALQLDGRDDAPGELIT